MEYYNRLLCVSYRDLTNINVGGDQVMKSTTLDLNIYRGNVERVHRGGGEGSQALIVYSSLPEKYRARYVAIYGDPEKLMKKAMMKDTMKLDISARAWFEGYSYTLNGTETHLTTKLIDEYTINASVLKELLRMMVERQTLRKKLNSSMAGVWDTIYKSSEALREKYGHTLPANLARLKDRLNAYKKDGNKSVISGKVGNGNTVKITEEAGLQLVALKRSRVPVYTDAQLFETFNDMADERGWKKLKSLSGMKQWLNSAAIEPLWYDAVYGEQAARQRFGRKHKTELPTRRDTLWYGDGTKLNLYYRDEDGKVRTKQVYEVIDAASEVLLGYYISDTEDYEAQYHAYRMAIQISGHKPYEIVHDNQGGHKKLDSGGLFGKICHVHRTTQPYNGESKTIESIFGRFQQQVLHKDWRFTGQNVTAKKGSSRPNVEFVEANKDSLYTLDELMDRYADARKEWNEMKHPNSNMRRIDMYNESVNEETQEVSVYDMVDMFWVKAERMCTFSDQGLTVTIDEKKHQYEVFSEPGIPDHAWRRTHTYQQFVVMYDPYDLTSIRLYSKDKTGDMRFERVAEPYIVIHRAIQDQVAGDAKFIRQEQAANTEDRILRQVDAKKIEYAHGVAPEQHGLNTPELKGTSKEERRQIEKRTARYSISPEEYQLGRKTKELSMEDWRDVTCSPEEEETTTYKKACGKL